MKSTKVILREIDQMKQYLENSCGQSQTLPLPNSLRLTNVDTSKTLPPPSGYNPPPKQENVMSLESLNLQNTQSYYPAAGQKIQNPFAREYNQIEDTYQNYSTP